MNDLIFGKNAEGYLGTCKTKSSTEVLCQALATEVAGKCEQTSEGNFIITSTLGGVVKYLYSKAIIAPNLNTHCALVASNAPMHETEEEIQIVCCNKTDVEWKAKRLVQEIQASLAEDMNDEVKIEAMDFLDLMHSEQTVWTEVSLDSKCEEDLWMDWFHLADHHHKCKVTFR